MFKRTPWIRSVLLFFALIIIVPDSVPAIFAAPITFRFDAIVGPPRQGVDGRVPPNWGISLQEGDNVSGVFTFEPIDVAPNISETTIVQPFDFSIQIDSRILRTSKYDVQVSNDSVSDESPEPTDEISLGCSYFGGGVTCDPANISPHDPREWAFGIATFGHSTLLDGADLPANPSVWQQMSGEILVSIRDRNADQFYGFLATLTSIREIPEPNSSWFFAIGTTFLFFTGVARHTRR
jgi:hypothetical protein